MKKDISLWHSDDYNWLIFKMQDDSIVQEFIAENLNKKNLFISVKQPRFTESASPMLSMFDFVTF